MSALDPIDSFKLQCICDEITQKIKFLALINSEDDASSELAGNQINKLLNEQVTLEN